MKELGNKLNDKMTVTTVLEKLRAIDQLQLGWTEFANGKPGWTWNGLGQSVYIKKRYDYIEEGRGLHGDLASSVGTGCCLRIARRKCDRSPCG